jgi:hypothetical protein
MTPGFILPAVEQKLAECCCKRLAAQVHHGMYRIVRLPSETVVLFGAFLADDREHLHDGAMLLKNFLPSIPQLLPFCEDPEVGLYLPCDRLNGELTLITEIPLDFILSVVDAEKGNKVLEFQKQAVII